jgi:Antitoxin MazE-like
MSSASKRKLPDRKETTSRQKVRAHRERLRAQGLRPIQVWVPDTRSPNFAAEASRQSRLVASSRYAAKDQAFIDAISIGGDE